MYSMAAFMNHSSYIIKLSRSIHKNEWRPCFCQRTIISTRSFAFPAFKVKMSHGFHFLQTIAKEGPQQIKALNCFFDQFTACLKRPKRLYPLWFCFYIPWTKNVQPKFIFFSLV